MQKLRNDPFYRQLIRLVIPIMIQSFMLALVSATDALMLGFVNQDSLSAVSLAAQVQFVLSLFISAVAGGLGILSAQYWGKSDARTIERVIPIGLRANLFFGAAFTLAALICPRLLMRIFTNDETLVGLGADYLLAVAPSYVLCGISQVYLAVLKNTDRTAQSSLISSSAVVINIVLNFLLIFGIGPFPELGIVGAALATTAARFIELVWSMICTNGNGKVGVRWKGILRFEKELSRDFWHYTSPLLMAWVVWGVAYTLYSVIMGHLGSDAVAAYSVTGIVKSLMSCLVRGIGTGAGIMVGNLLGAGELAKAKEYGGRLTRLSIAAGAVMGGALMLVSPLAVRVAGLSAAASAYLQGMLLFCGVNLAFQSVNITVLDGIFSAGGDSRFDMYGNLGAMWSFAVPLGFLAAFVLKLPVLAVFCIVSLDEIVKMPAVYLRYKRYIWVRNITKEHTA